MEFQTKANGVEKEITRNFRVPESKKVEIKVTPHFRPSVGTFVHGKKSMKKMKSLWRKLVQTSDSNSDADKDWVNCLSSGGWSEQ